MWEKGILIIRAIKNPYILKQTHTQGAHTLYVSREKNLKMFISD